MPQEKHQQKRKHNSASCTLHSHPQQLPTPQTDDEQHLHQQAHTIPRKHLSLPRRSRIESRLLAQLLLLYCLTTRHVSCAPTSPDPQSPNAIGPNSAAAPGSGEVMLPMKDANWLKGYEPSCDELRAMWRFSKRQSRASEITNEIPTFRADPFAMNMWQPSKPRIKQAGGLFKGRNPARYMYDRSGKLIRNTARNGIGFPQFMGLGPVFGRVVHKEPELMEFGYPVQPSQQQSQRRVQYRFPGPSPGNSPPGNAVVARMSGSTPLNVTPQRGSFMKLKELVWTERARELAHQRRNEEMQARAAVLKELANGGHGLSYQNGAGGQFTNQESYYQGGNGGLDYNGENGGNGEEESSYYDGSSMGNGPKLSHFRERNSFLQQQQQQQPSPGNGNSKINFPSKHSRLY